MNRPQLLQHFNTLAETPDAVEKLRKLVLDFAIRGRLVPQNLKDEPAIQLVERAKAGLTKKREKSTDQQNGEHEVLPFSLPTNWCWTCLEELGETSPRNELDDKTEVGFSPMRLVNAKFGVPILFERKTWGEVRKGFTHFAEGDVVVAKITPCFENGKSGVIRGVQNGFGAGTTEFHVLRPVANCVLPEYVLAFLKSPHFLINGEKHMTGSAGQKRVPSNYFAKTPFPLPPLAEQRRIVAKVEELLALCDELEARQTAAREHRTRLVRSALDHLTTAKDEPEFRKHSAFVLKHSDLLLDSVFAIRQAILSLAVQGRLLTQSAKDEPATEILNECQRAAKKLGIKTAEQTTSIGAGEMPFELPNGWAWARVRHLGYLLGGGTPSKSRSEFWEGNLPWVSPKDMKVAYLYDAQDHISRKALDESAVKLIPPGSILFVVRGMILIHSFPAAINKVEVTINQDMKALQPFVPENAEFLLLACRGFKQQMLDNVERSTHGTCKLVTERVTEFVICLPPLAEQKRIVAKVDELMCWCDALEARLNAAQSTASTLLDATLHKILAA